MSDEFPIQPPKEPGEPTSAFQEHRAPVDPPDSPAASLPPNGSQKFKRGRQFVRMKKSTFFWSAIVVLSVGIGVSTYFAMDKKAKFQDKRYQEILKEKNKLDQSNKEYKKKFEELEADRNNVLAQTKSLLVEKMKWSDVEEQLQVAEELNERFAQQKDELHQNYEKTQLELSALNGHFGRLKNAYSELQSKHNILDQENASLRAQVQRKVQDSPEFRRVDRENKIMKDEAKKLTQTIKTLEGALKKSQERIGKIQDRDKRHAKSADQLKKEIFILKSQQTKMSELNRVMNKAVEEAPNKFRGMAEENKTLTRETAEMHYNLGVFYAENRKVQLAIQEFRRATEIDPNNAKAHYNLGYLYAEEVGSAEDAATHFEKFLKISPNSKEAERVRTYIVSSRAATGKSS